MAGINIKWFVNFRKTNTGMGSEQIQHACSSEQDAEAYFNRMRSVHGTTDVKMVKVTEVRVAEVLKEAKVKE